MPEPQWLRAEALGRSPLDWTALGRAAERHGVLPLALRNLRTLPPDPMTGWGAKAVNMVRRNLLMSGVITEELDPGLLRRHGSRPERMTERIDHFIDMLRGAIGGH